MNTSELQEKVDSLGEAEEWNHYYQFPNGVKTKDIEADSIGNNSRKWDRLLPILKKIDLNGKSLVDIGCSDGYFSVQSAQEGCKSVLGIDADDLRVNRARLAKDVYELGNLEFENYDIYGPDLSDKKFDVVLALGILHRVPDLFNFLKRITEMGNTVVIEFKTYKSFFPVCAWGGEQKTNKHNKLYFIPSISFVQKMLGQLGYGHFEVYKDKSKLKYKRTIIVSRRSEV